MLLMPSDASPDRPNLCASACFSTNCSPSESASAAFKSFGNWVVGSGVLEKTPSSNGSGPFRFDDELIPRLLGTRLLPALASVPMSTTYGPQNRVRRNAEKPRAVQAANGPTSFAWLRYPLACPIARAGAGASCRRRSGLAPALFPASGSRCRSP